MLIILKTQLLLMGSVLNHDLPLQMIFKNISIWGIELTCNTKNLIDINYNPVIKIIKNSLNIWRQRDLCLFGRIEIIKTLGISRLNYHMSLIPTTTKNKLDEIDKSCMNSFGKTNLRE